LSALSELLSLTEDEKTSRGLVHTPVEIAQQPITWQATFDLFSEKRAEIADFLNSAGFGPAPSSAQSVFLVGAGTSDYIGRSLVHLLRKAWQCDVIAVPSTDLLIQADELLLPDHKYLWISFSRSGDSPEGVAVLEHALQRHPNVHHLVISCNANGRMLTAHAGDPRVLGICLDDAVNDRGLAMTSSFSNMVIFGQCLAHARDLSKYEPVLARLVQAGNNFLPMASDCAATLAKKTYTKACFVGSGPLRAVATESALKLLELTGGKVLTMSESALGLRHGPMAALDQDTLFVCFLSSRNAVQEYEKDLLNEIGNKHLVRTRVAVGGSVEQNLSEHNLAPADPFTVADEYRPALDVIFGQTLGLFFSLRHKLRPDCPSPNGAITRVVQDFHIHS